MRCFGLYSWRSCGSPRSSIRRRTDRDRTGRRHGRRSMRSSGSRRRERRPAPQQKVVLDQRNLAFVAPRVGGARRHDCRFSQQRQGLSQRFLVSRRQEIRSRDVSERLDQAYRVRQAWAGAALLQHPSEHGRLRDGCRLALFRRVERERHFTIAGVPPGTYTYHAWRPGGQPLTGSINVDGNTPLEVRW